MNLALVIPGFQADERDWCIPAFTNLARELAESIKLHVFALRYPGEKRNYKIGQVHAHAMGGGAFAGRRVVGASLLKLWRDALSAIEREHTKNRFDTIMGVWATESGWLATVAAKRLGLPSLVHLAGGELTWLPDIKYGSQGRGLARVLVRRCLINADMLTAPSGPMKQALLKYPGVQQSKVRSWGLGVDTRMFKPCEQAHTRPQAGPFTFLTVGSLIPIKGHGWLIEGVKGLSRAAPNIPFRLNIIGDGPLRHELQPLVSSLQLQGHVNLMGDVKYDDLPRHLQMGDCFLLGSRHEAQCMAALEAMACGLPWIAPAVGALADCAAAAQPSGILVEKRSTQTLVEAMAAILHASSEQRKTWGIEARQRVLNDYELTTQTARLLALVQELTA
jgi:glycosyltransferase involved in cell wall biosynthesis